MNHACLTMETSYDGVSGNRFGGKEGGHTHPRMRWNKFKMELFVANVCLSVYALTSLIFCLLTWFDVFEHANIVHIGNCTDFILSTIAAAAVTTTSIFGWAGILFNNRFFLTYYTSFL